MNTTQVTLTENASAVHPGSESSNKLKNKPKVSAKDLLEKMSAVTVATKLPCQGKTHLFTNAPHPSDSEFALMTSEQRERAANVKTSIEQEALNVCFGCPALSTCKKWASSTEVFGVAGGLLERERSSERSLIDAFIEGNGEPDARATAIALLNDGADVDQIRDFIEDRYGCKSLTTLKFLKKNPPEGADALEYREELVRKAETELKFNGFSSAFLRLNAGTARLYDVLAKTGPMEREKALRFLASQVTDAEALAWSQRKNRQTGRTRDQEVEVGRRDSAQQRLRYAVQNSHHLVSVSVGGEDGVALSGPVSKVWLDWRVAQRVARENS